MSGGVITDVSIRRFRTMKAVASYLRDLHLANGKPSVAVGYNLVVDEKIGGDLVFTEPLRRFDTWLKNKEKKMWLEDDEGKTTMGFRHEAKETFQLRIFFDFFYLYTKWIVVLYISFDSFYFRSSVR